MAGARAVPLIIEDAKLRRLEALVERPVIEVLPLRRAKVGVVTTGSEVFYGRIQDAFGPVLRKKFAALGSTVVGQTLTSDEVPMTAGAIVDFLEQGADLIVVTGGMSVDPDDRTPSAIRASGAEVASYGAPVYPGAMIRLDHEEPIGTKVEIFGPHIPLEQMAAELHTISYEIICLLSDRVTRIYTRSGKPVDEENGRLRKSQLAD